MGPFRKILIANRGEIAVRINRAAQKLGIKTLAVYAADDSLSSHVSQADEAILLPGDKLQDTYLDQDKLIRLALEKGAQAIHPGYGFLSENAAFAEKTERAGLTFIGATPEQIRNMGEKTQAITFVKTLQIPVIPGISGTVNDILSQRDKLEYPLLVKASGGGGGKGMEMVQNPEQLLQALKQAENLAFQYFGNAELFVEKYLQHARHIEVQVLGDGKGYVVHLFERECSIQRRYQKLIEEAPAISVSDHLKEKLYHAALKIARSIQYRGAGTVEFLVDENENFYFLEMNTRLQVEHPVTEMITGIDLVEWQLRIAAGEPLNLKQEHISATGHAIELRVCAEDVPAGFVPTSGTINEIQTPNNSRWESFLQPGITLSPAYDSLLGKLVVHGQNRPDALTKMKEVACNLFISGIRTNQDLLCRVLGHPDFIENSIHTCWLEGKLGETNALTTNNEQDIPVPELLAGYLLHHFYRPSGSKSIWEQSSFRRINEVFHVQMNLKAHKVVIRKGKKFSFIWDEKQFELNNCHFHGSKIEYRINKKDITIFISEKNHATIVQLEGNSYELRSNHVLGQVRLNKSEGEKIAQRKNEVLAELFGKVIKVLVKPGDSLFKGQNLMVIESMKSEFMIQSPVDAVVKNIHVSKGKIVHDKELLVDFES
jgi:acetyl/propionyl-CoA carboxylase alpha subunit